MKVRIEVNGGVAYVTKLPKEVEVEIVDYDYQDGKGHHATYIKEGKEIVEK